MLLRLSAESIPVFDGVPAPMVYAMASQVSAVVPFSVAGKAATEVQIEYNGRTSSRVTVAVLAAAPGIFTLTSSGSGQGAILNEDFRVNGPSAPVAPGKAVIFFGTGGGQTTPSGEDARVAIGAANVAAPVTVKIGGVQAEMIYAGAAPDWSLVSFRSMRRFQMAWPPDLHQ